MRWFQYNGDTQQFTTVLVWPTNSTNLPPIHDNLNVHFTHNAIQRLSHPYTKVLQLHLHSAPLSAPLSLVTVWAQPPGCWSPFQVYPLERSPHASLVVSSRVFLIKKDNHWTPAHSLWLNIPSWLLIPCIHIPEAFRRSYALKMAF